jgi:hypothetical protein
MILKIHALYYTATGRPIRIAYKAGGKFPVIALDVLTGDTVYYKRNGEHKDPLKNITEKAPKPGIGDTWQMKNGLCVDIVSINKKEMLVLMNKNTANHDCMFLDLDGRENNGWGNEYDLVRKVR